MVHARPLEDVDPTDEGGLRGEANLSGTRCWSRGLRWTASCPRRQPLMRIKPLAYSAQSRMSPLFNESHAGSG